MLPTLNPIDFGRKRPKHASVAIVEITSLPSHWECREGFYFLDNKIIVVSQILEILADIASFNDEHPNERVTLVVFPELSMPELLPAEIIEWSEAQDAIIVAGSHYHTETGRSNRCPVIVSGNIHYVTKIHAAPIEKSPMPSESLIQGKTLTVFNNTQAGNFSVAICSDFLEPALRTYILDQNLDLLCISAFQKESSHFHDRMHIAAQDVPSGVYLAYSNMRCDKLGDGRSACFGLTHEIFHKKLVEHHLTTSTTPTKFFELPAIYNYAITRLDIQNKRPSVPLTIKTEPNIHILLRRTNGHKAALVAKPITLETLARFIQFDELSKKIDAEAAVAADRPVIFAERFVAAYVPRFKYAKIDSIGQLLVELERHKELLVLFMSEWFKTNIGQGLSHVPAGFGTSLLCTMLVIDQNSPEGLLNYWENVIFNKPAGPENVSAQMCSALEAARQKIAERNNFKSK